MKINGFLSKPEKDSSRLEERKKEKEIRFPRTKKKMARPQR